MMSFTTKQVGAKNSLAFRAYLQKDGQIISAFHDVPLYADAAKKTFNMIVEIPKFSNAKLEISKDDALNPIKQDVKKGKLRFVKNVFPYHGYMWNYGAFPQTWEDPTHEHPDTKAAGDNDPLDVVEIGEKVGKTGEVKQVKVLGLVALLDEGETDWKIITIDVTDPLAEQLNGIADIEKHCPGLLKATVHWFRVYKIPDGKPENQFAFNGDAKDADYALQIVEETHQSWQKLIKKEIPNKAEKYDIQTVNSSVNGSPYKDEAVAKKTADLATSSAVEPLDASVDKFYYI